MAKSDEKRGTGSVAAPNNTIPMKKRLLEALSGRRLEMLLCSDARSEKNATGRWAIWCKRINRGPAEKVISADRSKHMHAVIFYDESEMTLVQVQPGFEWERLDVAGMAVAAASFSSASRQETDDACGAKWSRHEYSKIIRPSWPQYMKDLFFFLPYRIDRVKTSHQTSCSCCWFPS
jgi:hypothetical protein